MVGKVKMVVWAEAAPFEVSPHHLCTMFREVLAKVVVAEWVVGEHSWCVEQ